MLGQPGIVSDIVLSPDRKFEPARQIEEGDGAMLKLAAHNTFGRQAEPISIKGKRLFEVGDTERENGNPRFHIHTLSIGACRMQAP